MMFRIIFVSMILLLALVWIQVNFADRSEAQGISHVGKRYPAPVRSGIITRTDPKPMQSNSRTAKVMRTASRPPKPQARGAKCPEPRPSLPIASS